MKNIKLISMLILIAILSFSCGEDEDKDGNGKGNISGIDASKYLFQTNSRYFYDIEVIDSKGNKDYYKRNTEVYEFDSILGKFDMMYIENQEQSGLKKKNYLFKEGSKIYGINCGYNLSNHIDIHFSNSKYELFESILLIDFDKNEWESKIEFEYSPYDWSDLNISCKVEIFGRKLSEEKINYNEQNLNSFNIELIFIIDKYNFSEELEDYPKENKYIYTRNITLVENVGIIKDETELYFYEKNAKGEIYEDTIFRNFNLQKIEDMK